MNITAVRLNIVNQIIQRIVATLAIVGILALTGTIVSFVFAAALYAGVSIVHALWTILTLGGIRIPVSVPKREKTPVGFVCPVEAVGSSAARVREARAQRE